MKGTLFILLILLATNSVFAQQFRATAFEIKDRKDLPYGGHNVGKLFVTAAGKTRKIADEAGEAWIINDGREVVYSNADGSGGFENIGQSLWIYRVRTQKKRKIFSEYFPVTGITEARISNGARALLVRGYGAETECVPFAVVDPKRGEVFRHCEAALLKIKGDFITLAIDPDFPPDWFLDENNRSAFDPTMTKKFKKTRTYDLKKLLKRKVIYNRKTS